MADKHGAHKTSEAYVVSLCEDFCKSPVAPAGYMISQKLNMSILTCNSVSGCGTPVLNYSSRIMCVTGNEAGVGGGVVSGVNVGLCRPIARESSTVFAEGQRVLRHGTRFAMNCSGLDALGNIDGELNHIVLADTGGPLEKMLADLKQGDPKKGQKVGTVKDSNGRSIDVYESPNVAGRRGQYVVDDSGPWIAVPPGQAPEVRSSTINHELGHFEDDCADGCIDGLPNSGTADSSEILARERQIKYLESEEAKGEWPNDASRQAEINEKKREIAVIKDRSKATQADKEGLLFWIDNTNDAYLARRKLNQVGKCYEPDSKKNGSAPDNNATSTPAPTPSPSASKDPVDVMIDDILHGRGPNGQP